MDNNQRLLFDQSVNPKSLSNEEEQKRTRNYLGEAARVGALYTITSTVMKATHLFSSKSRNSRMGIAMAGAVGIALATSGDNNRIATLGGAMIMASSAVGLKHIAYKNVDHISNVLFNINAASEKVNRGAMETMQKYREFVHEKKSAAMSSGGDSIDIAAASFPLTNIFSFMRNRAFDGKKSLAFSDWEQNKDKYLYLHKKNKDMKFDLLQDKYLQGMLKREKTGWGPFQEVMKYTKKDGSINSQNLFKSGGDLSNIITYYNQNKSGIKEYMAKRYVKAGDFNMSDYIKYKIENNPHDKTNKIDQAFLKFYTGLQKDQKGVAKGSDLLEDTDIRNHVLNSIAPKFGFIGGETSRLADKIFGNININQIGKNSKGKLFDRTILDPSAWLVDAASFVQNSFRPVFSFLPSPENKTFSLIPIDLHGIKAKRGKSKFQFIKADENISKTIRNLEAHKRGLYNKDKSNGMYSKLLSMNLNSSQMQERLTRAMDQIDDKILTLKQKMIKHGEVKKDLFLDTDLPSEGRTFDIDYRGNIRQESDSTLVGFKDEEGNLGFMSGNKFKMMEGKFQLTYDSKFKNNLFRMSNDYIAEDFTGVGVKTRTEHYQSGTILDDIRESKGKVFRKRHDQVFKKELDETYETIKARNDEIKIKIADKNGIGIHDVDIALEGSDFEKFLDRHTEGLDQKDIDDLKIFTSLERRTKNFFDIHDIEDNRNPVLSSALKDNFVSSLFKEGYGNAEVLLRGKKQFNVHHIDKNFVNQRISTSRGVFAQKVTFKNGIKNFFKGLDFGVTDSSLKGKTGTVAGAYLNNMMYNMDKTLNFLGIHKMDKIMSKMTGGRYKEFDQHLANPTKTFLQLMTKRVAPIMLGLYAAQAVEGATDAFNPYSDTGVGGMAVAGLAAARVGFQYIMQGTGLQGAANYLVQSGFGGFVEPLDLNLSVEEMKDRYFRGKEVEIRRNRFWFGGNRTSFAGTDTKEFRKSWFYRMQHRDSGIYKDKKERFWREDFVVSKILSRITNPYLEEQRLQEKGLPLDRSEKLFTDVPVFGELLAQTVGRLIKPFKYYNDDERNQHEVNPLISITNRALSDLATWGGYEGYAMGAVSNFLLGGSSVKQIARNDFGANTDELASIDAVTSLRSKFYDMDIGGMFGMTEPIRRILTNDEGRVSYMKAATKNEAYNATLNMATQDNNLTVLRNKTKQVDPNDDQLVQNLKTMGNIAPYSAAYRSSVKQAEYEIGNDPMSARAKQLRSLISLGRAVKNRDTTVSNKYQHVKLSDSFMMQADQVLKPGEFLSDGKRYKLAGIETDYNKLADSIGGTRASQELTELSSYMEDGNQFRAVRNQDMLSAVKTDDKGQYIEVYSQELSNKFSDMKTSHYLATASGGMFKKAMAFGLDAARKPSYGASNVINKSMTGRSVTRQFINETQINPTFRSWENPLDSFVKPLFDTAASSGLGLSKSLMLSKGMGGGTASNVLSSALVGARASTYITGGNMPANYAKQDKIQMSLEDAKYAIGSDSIYTLNEYSSSSQLKKSLTTDEQHMFYSLINTDSSQERAKIYNAGSDRLKRVIDISQAQKLNYIGESHASLAHMRTPKGPAMHLSGDYFYDLAKAKRFSGYTLNDIEKHTINTHRLKQEYFENDISENIKINNANPGVDSTVTSTTFGGNSRNNIY